MLLREIERLFGQLDQPSCKQLALGTMCNQAHGIVAAVLGIGVCHRLIYGEDDSYRSIRCLIRSLISVELSCMLQSPLRLQCIAQAVQTTTNQIGHHTKKFIEKEQ